MDKYLKKWLEKAFNAGRNAGYWEQDHDGCREVYGYFSFDEWLNFIECEGKETPDELSNCIKPTVSCSASMPEFIPLLISYFYPTNPPTNSDEMFKKRIQIIEILNKLKAD